MINLRNSPFLWFALLLLIAFGISAIAGYVIPAPLLMVCAGMVSAGALAGLMSYAPGTQVRSTIAISVMILSAALIRMHCFYTQLFPDPPLSSSLIMEGTVEVTEVLKVNGNKLSLRCQSISLSGRDTSWHYTDPFILVQIRDNPLDAVFPGDRFHIEGWTSAITGPFNPEAFDARVYYRSIGIRHQIHVKGQDIHVVREISVTPSRLTARWQSTLCHIVSAHTSDEVAQLTNALVWGDRSSMNQEVRDAFADAGAMHVLSVSGMHMAMIYSMLYLLLGAPGSGNLFRRVLRFVMYCLAILLYMGLTGACPAVVRSGLMILLYLLGKAMGWNTPVWNLLGFAAFIMLWMNPFVALHTGFQLSFLAMAGILLYAQPMIRMYAFKNIILQRAWEITAVSLAAQVFILPVILRQFYQFPLTFIASSFVAMPASYIVIFGSLLNIVLSAIGFHALWPIYEWACHYFIESMKWMAALNPAMNYSMPPVSALALMIMSILFSAALVWRWRVMQKLSYAMGFLVFLTLGCHRADQWQASECILYYQYNGLLIDIISEGRCVSIQDSSLTPASVEFAARGHRCHRDIVDTEIVYTGENFKTNTCNLRNDQIRLPGISIFIWNEENTNHTPTTYLTHIIINKCEDIYDLKNFLCNHPEATVILPAHLKASARNTLSRYLDQNEIQHWDISKKGYYRISI